MLRSGFERTSLRGILEDQGKLTPDRALRIAISICEALEYIHGRGVAHRDLKPENIIVGQDNAIRLIDFGIASKPVRAALHL